MTVFLFLISSPIVICSISALCYLIMYNMHVRWHLSLSHLCQTVVFNGYFVQFGHRCEDVQSKIKNVFMLSDIHVVC